MADNTPQASAITMSGGGRYSLATVGAKHVIDNAAPLLLQALAAMTLPRDRFTFCDMGCADGGTSLDTVRAMLTALRARTADLPIVVVHADQPGNDFNALAAMVHGHSDAAQGFTPYLDAVDGVYPLLSATSFYRQIIADGQLDLGFSATAMHWLSRLPAAIDDHVHAVGASGAKRDRFAAHAARDWETILLRRAAELRRGARLVLVNFCIDETGRYLGNTGGVNMFDTLNALWRERVDDGRIDAAEYRAMTLPQYYRSLAEFRAPFDDPGSAVSRAGLVLEHAETRVVLCPFAADFSQHGDAERFAAAYVPTIRSWNESIFLAALSPRRPRAERLALIDEYYDSYRRRVAAAPRGHGMDYVHAYMTIVKRR